MKHIFEKLAQVADSLDSKGLKSTANRIDNVLQSMAQNAPTAEYDITTYHKVAVPNAVYNKHLDPRDIPEKHHRKVDTDIVVAPRSGYNVGEAIESKSLQAKNLTEARNKAKAVVEAYKRKYKPATGAEQSDFYPV